MIRIPAPGDTVILTRELKFSIRVTLEPKMWHENTILPALTRCKITDVFMEKDGLEFMLETLDRETADIFMLGPNTLVDGCYPFTVFPPNKAEAAYWHGRVFEALDASVIMMGDDITPEQLEYITPEAKS